MGNLLNQTKKIEPKTVNIHEVKTYIGLIEIKVNQQKQKKLKEISNKRKEIGKCLMNNQLEIAKLKMENIISDEDFVAALDIFSTLIEIIKEKTVYLLSFNKCPEDMRATLDTIIYCSMRFDIAELEKLRQAITIQYGSLYVSNAQSNVDKLVNIPIIERLGVKNHPNFMLLTRIKQIAIEEKVDYYFPPEFEYSQEENSSGQQNFFPNNSVCHSTGYGDVNQNQNMNMNMNMNNNIGYDPYQNQNQSQNNFQQTQFGNNQSQNVNINTNTNFNQTQFVPNTNINTFNPQFQSTSFNNFNQNMNNTAPLNYQFNNNLGQSQFHSNFNQSQFGIGYGQGNINQGNNQYTHQISQSQFGMNNINTNINNNNISSYNNIPLNTQTQTQQFQQSSLPNQVIQSQILGNQFQNTQQFSTTNTNTNLNNTNTDIYRNSYTNISSTNINNPYENNLAKSEVVFQPTKDGNIKNDVSESVNFSNYSKFNQNSDGNQGNNVINSEFTVGYGLGHGQGHDNPYGNIGSSINFFPTVSSSDSKKVDEEFP